MPMLVYKQKESSSVGRTCRFAMESPQRTEDRPFIWKFSPVFFNNYKLCGQGGDGFIRWLILCLGLLNAILLIAAVVLGINCAKVKEGSLNVSHSAVTQVKSELDYLKSNHSDVIKAEEGAKRALESAFKNHDELKVKINQQKTINDGYERQIAVLRTEKSNLQTNISALESSCGRCLSGWSLFNSSCYFFSSIELSSVKKNWIDSRADCTSRGSDLVVIDNKEEQKFVSNSIKTLKENPISWPNGFWVGLTDIQTVGTWVWINNVTEVENRYWVDGEPNVEEENCVIVVYSRLNPWKTRYDGNCKEHNLHWICETPSI